MEKKRKPSGKARPRTALAHPALALPAIALLAERVEACGYRLLVRGRQSGGCAGYFDLLSQTILVHARDERGRLLSDEDFTFHLAHEVRHLIHAREGLFAPYYDRTLKARLAAGSFDLESPDDRLLVPDLGLSLAAERDCDRYAESFVRRHLNHRFRLAGSYPLEAVAHYELSLAAAA